jgi:hypothetical protein
MGIGSKSLLVLSLLAALVSCGRYDHQVSVADVTKEEVIILKKEPGKGFVHTISIHGSGNIDGEARILWIVGGSPQTESLKGKVNFTWSGDWFSDTAEIRYEPVNVSKGGLVIEYHFATIE